MRAEILVGCDMVDDDRLAAAADFIADRRFDAEFSARQESEGDLVAHRASDPSLFCDPGHRRKTHAGGPADDFQNGSDRSNVSRDCRVQRRRDPGVNRRAIASIGAFKAPICHSAPRPGASVSARTAWVICEDWYGFARNMLPSGKGRLPGMRSAEVTMVRMEGQRRLTT